MSASSHEDAATFANMDGGLDLLAGYCEARRELLKAVGVSDSCRDPLAEFAEWIVARWTNGRLADSRVERGYDVISSDGRKLQIKCLSNPAHVARNGIVVRIPPEADDFVVVWYKDLTLQAIVLMPRKSFADVYTRLGKRHSEPGERLDLYEADIDRMLKSHTEFTSLGVRIWKPN